MIDLTLLITDHWDAVSVSIQKLADAHGSYINPISGGFQAQVAWHICTCSCADRIADKV